MPQRFPTAGKLGARQAWSQGSGPANEIASRSADFRPRANPRSNPPKPAPHVPTMATRDRNDQAQVAHFCEHDTSGAAAGTPHTQPPLALAPVAHEGETCQSTLEVHRLRLKKFWVTSPLSGLQRNLMNTLAVISCIQFCVQTYLPNQTRYVEKHYYAGMRGYYYARPLPPRPATATAATAAAAAAAAANTTTTSTSTSTTASCSPTSPRLSLRYNLIFDLIEAVMACFFLGDWCLYLYVERPLRCCP